jgi:hypothetical protein
LFSLRLLFISRLWLNFAFLIYFPITSLNRILNVNDRSYRSIKFNMKLILVVHEQVLKFLSGFIKNLNVSVMFSSK